MKAILLLVLTILFALILEQILPWWSVAIAALAGSFFAGQKNGFKSFFLGLLAIGLLWGLKTTLINSANDGVLAQKVAELLQFQGPVTLILISSLIGGLLGGFGALTGDLLDQLVRPAKAVVKENPS